MGQPGTSKRHIRVLGYTEQTDGEPRRRRRCRRFRRCRRRHQRLEAPGGQALQQPVRQVLQDWGEQCRREWERGRGRGRGRGRDIRGGGGSSNGGGVGIAVAVALPAGRLRHARRRGALEECGALPSRGF